MSMSTDDRDFSALLNTRCERKMVRKTKKKLKSACRLAHAQHKKVETVIREQFDTKSKEKKKKEKRKRQRARRRLEKAADSQQEHKNNKADQQDAEESDQFEREDCTLEQFREEAERVRQQRLRGEVGDDDQEIKRLEAKLRKSKKRKNKAASDGSDDDDDELEKILFNGSTSEED